MTEIITYGGHEYRQQGGEIHRRPAEREGMNPVDASWLVVSKKDEANIAPAAVVQHFAEASSNLRFD